MAVALAQVSLGLKAESSAHLEVLVAFGCDLMAVEA